MLLIDVIPAPQQIKMLLTSSVDDHKPLKGVRGRENRHYGRFSTPEQHIPLI